MESVRGRRRRQQQETSELADVDAFIYGRVSTEEQRDGASPTAQDEECRQAIARHTADRWVYARAFFDVESGRKDDRADYQALLLAVRASSMEGRRAVVVVAALDRLGRRVAERARAYEDLKARGVQIYAEREGGFVTEFTYNVLAAVAQEESRRTGERVQKSLEAYQRHGWHVPGPAPWGYRWRERTKDEHVELAPKSVLEVHPDEAPYVREAWERRANGESIKRVATWIGGLPALARGNRTLAISAVQKIFRAPTYVARYGHGDDNGPPVLSRPVGRWPALVSDAIWARCEQLAALAETLPPQAKGDYPLTGRIYCARCGSRMSGRSVKARPELSRVPRRDYLCQSSGQGARSRGECYYVVPTRAVEEPVLANLIGLLAAVRDTSGRSDVEGVVRAQVKRALGGDVSGEKRVERIDRELERIRGLIGSASVQRVEGKIDDETYLAARGKLNDERAALLAERERLVATMPRRGGNAVLDAVLAGVRDWERALTEVKGPALREALAVLVERIVPERVAHNRYRVHIQYTDIGLALLEEAATRGAKIVRLVSASEVGVNHNGVAQWSTPTPDGAFALDDDGAVAISA